MSHRVALAAAMLSGCALWSVACWRRPSGHETTTVELNARCYDCHVDFRGEQLTEFHERAGVGCVRCHGPSEPHMEDEVRRTPADAAFRGKAMDVFCLSCHSPAHFAKVAAHIENDTVPPSRRKTCTGCHGDHVVVETTPPR